MTAISRTMSLVRRLGREYPPRETSEECMSCHRSHLLLHGS